MPKRSNDFQTLIKTVYEQIVPEGGTVKESGMIRDKEAGILREVDIIVEYRYAGHDFRFIVECRGRSRKENVEWIDALIGKTKTLDVHKVIAVSSTGFASSAIRKGKQNGIELLTLKKALETDWTQFPFKPGLMLMSDDVYRINDVLYESKGEYTSVLKLGLESEVEIDGKVVGSLKEFVEYFFKTILVPQIDKQKQKSLLEIFKSKSDIGKALVCESEHTWSGVSVMTDAGKRIELTKIKFIVIGKRKAMDICQDHYVFNKKMVSRGTHLNADGSAIDFNIVQDPDNKQVHVRWKRTDSAE